MSKRKTKRDAPQCEACAFSLSHTHADILKRLCELEFYNAAHAFRIEPKPAPSLRERMKEALAIPCAHCPERSTAARICANVAEGKGA